MKAGDLLELRIEKAVYRGLGLAHHEGCVVFVPRTYGGERVRARVDEVGRGYVRAQLEALLDAAPARRSPPCRYAPRCGGCAHQDLGYDEQLRVKEAILRESLARARVPWDAEVPLRPSPETGWRTRAELHVAWEAAGPRLGFHEEASHELIDVEECLQLSSGMNRSARALLAALAERGPLARHVHGLELAESSDGGELVACLATRLAVREAAALSALGDGIPRLSGLLAVAGEPGGGATVLLLKGEPFVHAQVGGLRLRAHQRSFFQANRFLLEPLIEMVLGLVPPGGPVLDLYSGVGLFALPLAQRGDDVRAVEVSPLAVADAEANASAAGIRNVRFLARDVETALRGLARRSEERILLDPPRTGASRLAVRAIAARQPAAITYVSCDPPTLGRDLSLFAGMGYRLTSLHALDMFPDTFHVESVAQLERA